MFKKLKIKIMMEDMILDKKCAFQRTVINYYLSYL